MKELEKYFDIAAKAQLKNVPLSESELEQLLANKTIGGTTQNLFKRFFKNFGKLKIMTITSIIAAFVACLYLGTVSPNSDTKSEEISNKKEENGSIHILSGTSEKDTTVQIGKNGLKINKYDSIDNIRLNNLKNDFKKMIMTVQ